MKTRHTDTATKTASSCADAQSTTTFAVNPSDLYALRDTLALCCFAAEAHRVLEEIDLACQIYPEIETTLSRHIEARSEWRSMGMPLSAVLKLATQQVEDMLEDV